MVLKKIVLFFIVLVLALMNVAHAANNNLKDFVPGSYQQILQANANAPFMMVVWSVTCSSCLKDMALLNKLHQSKPGLKMVMLATDGKEASSQVQAILQKSGLASVENWNYADDNPQRLQYEIDPAWFGELPRTYFFDKTHQREGVSEIGRAHV